MLSPAPLITGNDGVIDAVRTTLGAMLIDAVEAVHEISLTVARDRIVDALRLLRDAHAYQQLMEIAGVDYPDRAERFEVVYHLLSLTRNHRIRVRVSTDEDNAVPSVTGLWPNAGWLEREVFDMYGVVFSGNPDLRRILTDYGFRGHPQRKDFPLTGYVELRYSEEEKRVAYQPVQLSQEFRSFDFMSPWEGAEYILPGDEKAPQAPGAPSPLTAKQAAAAPAESAKAPPPATPKVTEKPSDTGAGAKAGKVAARRSPRTRATAAKPRAPRKPRGKA